MKRCVAGLALLFACGLAHGMSWADLWSRPEQQTLAQRQQAYTEAQGQQFAAAAEHLKPFSDPVSQYNRGNALAHTGDLQAAISAYDSVLHSRMVDGGLQRDAQHNRDLVEQQMKSQPQSDKSGQKGEKNQQNGNGKEDGKGGKEDKNSGAGKDQGKSDPGDKGQGDKKPNDAKQSDTKQSESAQDKKDQSAKGANAQSADQPPIPESSQQQAAQREPESKDPATQGQPTPADPRPREGSPTAQSEQAQSLDQWLRWIPDDPAGLLRRKFMIEHMRHQSESQQ